VSAAPSLHVVVSHVVVDPVGTDVLERAFADRLGEVEDAEGFVRLEVWRSDAEDGRYAMVTWWESEDAFRRYMGSEPHRRSHARIPTEPAAPKGAGLDRYTLVAR
jgi:heme oxygenase (mycobilin-producing)